MNHQRWMTVVFSLAMLLCCAQRAVPNSATDETRPRDGESASREVIDPPVMHSARQDALCKTAESHISQYRYEDAIRMLLAARATVGNGPVSSRLDTLLGIAYERLENYERAEAHFTGAIVVDGQCTDARFALARLYFDRHDAGKSKEALEALLKIAPAHERARSMLAQMYLLSHQPDEALKQYQELLRATQSPMTTARCKVLIAQFTRFDPTTYREALIQAMDSHGEDATTWIAIAESYTDFESAQARDACLRALALEPENEEATIGLIQAEWLGLEFEMVARLWEKLLPRRPNRLAWRKQLVEAYWIIQDFETALNRARGFADEEGLGSSAHRRCRILVLDTLLQADRIKDAIDEVRAWQQEDETDAYWRGRLAGLYRYDDKPMEAAALFAKLVEDDPSDTFALDGLTQTLIEADRPDRAVQYALDRLRDDPDNDEALVMVVNTLSLAGLADDAIKLVRNKLLSTHNSAGFQQILIRILGEAGKHEERAEYLEHLIDEQLSPGFRQELDVGILSVMLIEQLIASGEYDDAHRRAREALRVSTDPQLRFNHLMVLARCQDAQGDTGLAMQTKQQALAIQGDNIMLNNDIAYGWIDRGIRLEEAEPMIRFSLARAPRQGAYLDTYGWLLYKRGEFAEAHKWLRRALGPGKGDPVISDHLGDACWRLGRREEAIAQWQKAVALIREREGDQLGPDQQRVRDSVDGKIDQAQSGGSPACAPLQAAVPAPDSADKPASPPEDQ